MIRLENQWFESPGGVQLKRIVWDDAVSDAEEAQGADIEDEDVVNGAPGQAVSGFESERFTFPKIVRGKGLERQTLYASVVDKSLSFHNVSFWFFNIYC